MLECPDDLQSTPGVACAHDLKHKACFELCVPCDAMAASAGKVEELGSDVVAPQSVDVLVSEWMGYMGGLFETMCALPAHVPAVLQPRLWLELCLGLCLQSRLPFFACVYSSASAHSPCGCGGASAPVLQGRHRSGTNHHTRPRCLKPVLCLLCSTYSFH